MFVKTATILWQYKRHIICEKLKLPRFLPVLLLPSAKMHRSQSKITIESQKEDLSAVSQSWVPAA